jgi:hypothetical protein
MLLAFADIPQRRRRLSIFPVLAADEPELSYLSLTEAMDLGVLLISEASSDNGPCLVAHNRGNQPILILDCETLEGLGTKLSANQSVLLGPGSLTQVPTACTETARWGCRELEKKFSRQLGAFPLMDGQVGILAFMGQNLLGLDVLGTPQLYAPLHRRLVTGYLMAAMGWGNRGRFESPAEESELQALAASLERAHRVAAPCPGSGEYTTIHGEVTGGELRHNGHLVHLSVFPCGVAA